MSATINFAGDIGLFRKYEEAHLDPLHNIILPHAEYSIGNFEFIQPQGNRSKAFFDVNDRYRCSYEYFEAMDLRTFDSYGLANNHAMDYGVAGLEDVIKVFQEKNITWFGVSDINSNNTLKFSVNEISFVVIGGVSSGRWDRKYYGYGPEPIDSGRIIALVEHHIENVDHVIVFLHWGSELVDIPPPENVEFAKKIIDAGATAVIGHHPHVPQGIQRYKAGVIAYSLGSFVYIPDEEAGFEPGVRGRDISIVLNVEFDKKGIRSVSPYYYQYNPETLLPEKMEPEVSLNYAKYLDENVENSKEYTRVVRKQLVRREIKLFWERFKSAPFSTLKHYINYISVRHVKKIIG